MPVKTRSSTTAPATPFSAAPWNYWTEVSRWQMTMATKNACALFRGMEAVRTVQQQMAHQTLTQHEAAAEQLQASCAPADLLSIQSVLLRSDLQGALHYWQQLGGAVLQAQLAMLDGSKKILGPTVDDPFKPILQAWQNAIPHPFDNPAHPTSIH